MGLLGGKDSNFLSFWWWGELFHSLPNWFSIFFLKIFGLGVKLISWGLKVKGQKVWD